MFIGRNSELKRLERMYASGKLEFATVYGRRRVGKTTLINKFISDKKYIFLACQKSSEEDNLIELSKQISIYIGYSVSFSSFIEALRAIVHYASAERLIFVMDEFPYLAKKNDNAVSSVLQNILDHEGKNSKLFLILSGSSIPFMEDEVLGRNSPLHGRITGEFRLQPMDYYVSTQFVPSYSAQDKALIYGITGGVPRYLELFDDRETLKENLLYNIFDMNSVLFNERENYLKEEFSDVSTYSSILNAISSGCTKISDIASRAGIQSGSLPSYLTKLREVGIIDKIIPIGESEKKGIWRICDLFFRFHSFFVARNISTIVSGRMPDAYDKVVEPYLNDFMGKVFEDIVRQFIEKYAELPFPLGEVGTWWGGSSHLKKEIEIDVVAKSAISRESIIAIAKYRERKMPLSELDLMRLYAAEMGGNEKCTYWFFSKSGFEDDFKEIASKSDDIKLFSIEELYNPSIQ